MQSPKPNLIGLQTIHGSDQRAGLRLTTSWGVRILLNADEVEALCRALPDVFPEHFAVLDTWDSSSEDAG